MRRALVTTVLTMSALLISGCGASIINRQVKVDGTANPDPQGIRYKGVMPFEVRIFTVEDVTVEENRKPVVKQAVRHHEAQILFLPDPRQLYEINYRGALFRSYSFTTTYRENSTLEALSLEALQEAQVAAAATAVGEVIKSFREAEEARRKAHPEKDKLQRELDVLDLRVKIKEAEEKLGGTR